MIRWFLIRSQMDIDAKHTSRMILMILFDNRMDGP